MKAVLSLTYKWAWIENKFIQIIGMLNEPTPKVLEIDIGAGFSFGRQILKV